MGMGRINARNYAVYLQRRVEDFGVEEQPVPKWTERDLDAVREVLREFRILDQHNELMANTLRDNGLQIPAPILEMEDDEVDPVRWKNLDARDAGDLRPWWKFW
jgi:hypothetical protein